IQSASVKMRMLGSVMLACSSRSSASVYGRTSSSLIVSSRPSTCLGGVPSCCAKCMSWAASTVSRTAPRAQSMTSVVSTLRMPSSWQKPISRAVTPADLQVAPQARCEARADRLEDRVDEERLAELPQVSDGRVQAVEVVGRVGDQHGRRAELPRHVEVVPGEAEDVVHAGRVGHEDLVGVERVDAEREAAGLEVADHLRPLLEPGPVEREPEIDDVGAGVAVVARHLGDPLAVEVRDVVDLGEDADVARAVA